MSCTRWMGRLTTATLSSVIVLFTLDGDVAAEPTFSFIESNITGKHIAVQPKSDYFRVYSPVRIRDMAGKRAFVRLRWVPDGDAAGKASAITSTFRITNNNEVWKMHFRVPRFAQRTATYQIELGEHDSSKLNEHEILASFGWRIERDGQGQIRFVHRLDVDSAVFLPAQIRTATIVGGKIQYGHAFAVQQGLPVDLTYGFTQNGANIWIDGDQVIERVE